MWIQDTNLHWDWLVFTNSCGRFVFSPLPSTKLQSRKFLFCSLRGDVICILHILGVNFIFLHTVWQKCILHVSLFEMQFYAGEFPLKLFLSLLTPVPFIAVKFNAQVHQIWKVPSRWELASMLYLLLGFFLLLHFFKPLVWNNFLFKEKLQRICFPLVHFS